VVRPRGRAGGRFHCLRAGAKAGGRSGWLRCEVISARLQPSLRREADMYRQENRLNRSKNDPTLRPFLAPRGWHSLDQVSLFILE
jgi:hypothetical protein